MKLTASLRSLKPPQHILSALTAGIFVLPIACEGPESHDIALTTGETSNTLLAGNGLPSNGLPSNGLPSNGLPSNGLPSNGLTAPGLQSASFSNWFHWFQGCGTADGCDPNNPVAGSTGSGTPTSRALADTIMKYIVQCACPASATVNYSDRTNAAHSWQGRLGLAPTWCSPNSSSAVAATVADGEWVTACLEAVVNRNGSSEGSMQISLQSTNSEVSSKLAPTAAEQAIYTDTTYTGQVKLAQSYFYGNIFSNATNQGTYGALSSPDDAKNLARLDSIGRDCALGGCSITPVGFNSTVQHKTNPFPTTVGSVTLSPPNYYTACWTGSKSNYCTDTQSRNWTRYVVVRLGVAILAGRYGGTAPGGSTTDQSTACTADANGQYLCSEKGDPLLNNWTQVQSNLTSGYYSAVTPAITFPAGSNYVLRTRYKSNASANLILTDTSGCIAQHTYTLPATGNLWQFFNVPFTPNGSCNPTFRWKYSDSTSPSADLDMLLFAIQ